jgi:hypothetical protein
MMVAYRFGDLREVLPAVAGESETGYEGIHPCTSTGTGRGDGRILREGESGRMEAAKWRED